MSVLVSPAPKTANFLLASLSLHKWVLKQGTADAQLDIFATDYEFRPYFDALIEYITHHSVPETAGTQLGNAELKLESTAPNFNELRPDGALHEWFLERLLLKGRLKSTHDFDERLIIHAVDDAATAIPEDIYAASMPELSEWAPRDLLDAGRVHIEGKRYATVHEIGPLTKAMGGLGFWSTIRKNARALKYADDAWVAYEQVTILARRMSEDPKSKPFQKDYQVPFSLRALDQPAPGRLQGMDHFFRALPGQTAQVADHYLPFLKSQHNIHNLAVGGLMRYAADGLLTPRKAVLGYTPQAEASLYQKVAKAQKNWKPFIVQPVAGGMVVDGKPVDSLGEAYPIHKRGIATATWEDKKNFFDTLSMEFDGRHADALIFMPIDPNDQDEKIRTIAKIKSAIVAKQLDPRYANVPLIFCNLRGCYDEILAEMAANSTAGFNGNFDLGVLWNALGRTAEIGLEEDVTFEPTAYYHELKCDDEAGMARAAESLLTYCMKDYVRHELSEQDGAELIIVGTPAPKGVPTVTGVCSAPSDLLPLNLDIRGYFKFVGDLCCAAASGGGDQHAMGAMIEGYNESNDGTGGIHFTMASTFDIEAIECKTGVLRGYDLAQRSRIITPRLATLITGEPEFKEKATNNDLRILTVFDGGPGTDQEDSTALAAKMILADAMKNQYVIFYLAKYSSKGDYIKSLLGGRDFDALMQDHSALEHRNILFATTMDELKEKTKKLVDSTIVPSPANNDNLHKHGKAACRQRLLPE